MAERGSLTVEAAFVIPVVLLVLVAVMEAVATVGAHLQLVVAAREGARVAATTPDPSRAVEATRASLPSGMASKVRISVERPSVAGEQAVVVIRHDRRLVTPLLDMFTIPLRARAVMAVEP